MFRLLIACLILFACCTAAIADKIQLHDGRIIHGQVIEYQNGVLRLRDTDGKDLVAAINQVLSIRFEDAKPVDENTLIIPPPSEYEAPLRVKIEAALEQMKQANRQSAVVGLYLDTESIDEPIPKGFVEYRCYRGGGYTGAIRVPLRQPWTRLESVHNQDDGARRIQIDPGPPYEIINRDVTLTRGEATNLGRIVLRKAKADRPVSLSGYVQDSEGNPIEGARVSAGTKRSVTDAEGIYKLNGFGLEVVKLAARKPGFIGGGATVSIRDTKTDELAADITLYRPRRVKLRYAISGKGSNSFEGPEVQTGTIEREVKAMRVDLSRSLYASESFTEFAANTHLYLSLRTGELTLDNSYAPIYYQLAEPDVGFDTIKKVGKASINAQHCPPLREGATLIICGFREVDRPRPGGPRGGVSPYCVKILVEELSELPDE